MGPPVPTPYAGDVGELRIQYCHLTGHFRWAALGTKPIPASQLVNMLELLKMEALGVQAAAMAQAAQQQAGKHLVVPDGAPLPNLRH